MPMDTNAQQALAKMNQGPVAVMFDPDGTAFEAFVRGGLNLTLGRGLEESETDLVGVYDLRTSGDRAEFELAVSETSLNILNVLFPDGASGPTYRGFGRTAGLSMRTLAKKVRVRPWQTRNSADEQIELWLVVPSGDAAIAMTKTEPHTFTVPFRALPDLTKADGELIGRLTAKARA